MTLLSKWREVPGKGGGFYDPYSKIGGGSRFSHTWLIIPAKVVALNLIPRAIVRKESSGWTSLVSDTVKEKETLNLNMCD